MAIIILATGFLAFVTHRATSSEFVTRIREELLQAVDPIRQDELATRIEKLYREGGMRSVMAASQQPELLAEFDNLPFVIVDSDLSVVATTELPYNSANVERLEGGGLFISSSRRIDGRAYDIELRSLSPRLLRTNSQEVFGELILLPESIDHSQGSDFALSVWKDAAPVLLFVFAMGTVLIAWAIRRALSPIERLTRAVTTLKEGEFPEEIETAGAGPEFNRLIATFNAATQSLERTKQLRKQLISDISHELRTPITNVKGQVEAVQQGLIEADASFLETLEAETRLLERLVKDLHEIAISDAGQLRLVLQPLPLRETVDSIVGFLAEQSSAKFVNAIHEQYYVLADEERFRQILVNLFDNARREKSKNLRIETSAEAFKGQVFFKFEDNGPGVAEVDQPHIFDRFYRAEKSRNRSSGGAGLGLAIVKGLVTAMNGSIRYESSASGGAAFVLSFPRVSGDQPSRHE